MIAVAVWAVAGTIISIAVWVAVIGALLWAAVQDGRDNRAFKKQKEQNDRDKETVT